MGKKEIPDSWVKDASELTEEEKQKFILSDNITHGTWDYDILVKDYTPELLEDVGIDMSDYNFNTPEYKPNIAPEQGDNEVTKAEIEASEQAKEMSAVIKKKKTIICPHCFEEFEIDE